MKNRANCQSTGIGTNHFTGLHHLFAWHLCHSLLFTVLLTLFYCPESLFAQHCGQGAQFQVTITNDTLHFRPVLHQDANWDYSWTWQYPGGNSGNSNTYELGLPLQENGTSLTVALEVNTVFDSYQCDKTLSLNANCDEEADFEWSLGYPLPQEPCLVRFDYWPYPTNYISSTWDLGDGNSYSGAAGFWYNYGAGTNYTVCHTVFLQDASNPSNINVFKCCKEIEVPDCPPLEGADPGFTPYEMEDCCRLRYWFVSGYQGGSHTWSFGDGTTSTDINPVHYYANISTYPGGTPSVEVKHCVTENSITQCTTTTVIFSKEAIYVGSPGATTSLNSVVSSISGQPLFPGGSIGAQRVSVAGELQIDKSISVDFTFDGTTFCMDPAAGMRLMPSRKMTLTGGAYVNSAPGCSIWRGIDLDGTSTFTGDDATIRHALYGLRTVGVGNARTVRLSDVLFRNNYIGIFADRLISVTKFDDNIFSFGTGNVLPPLGNLQIAPATGATAYLTERSYAGIVIANTPFSVPASQGGSDNLFENLANGILIRGANATIRRCGFKDIWAGGYYPDGGYGIQLNDPSGGRQFRQFGLGTGENDPFTFKNCRIAISVINGGPNTFARSQDNKMDVEIGYDFIIAGSLVPNSPATSLIHNNSINASGSHGIFGAFQSGSPSALRIQSNQINANGLAGQGIWLLGLGDATQHDIHIKDHSGQGKVINVAAGGQIGINLQKISGVSVENNEVNLAWSSTVPKGIYLTASTNNTLRCNYITGGYNAPDNNDTSIGLLVESSGTNTYETNQMTNTREAIRFDGQCGSTVLACNTMEEHKAGLYYTQTAISGEQKDRGNRWLNWPDNASVSIGAQHDGDVDIFGANVIQFSHYHALPNSDQTPASIVMPNNQDPAETWFYSGSDVACDGCGDMQVNYPINGLDSAIVSGGWAWGAHQEELERWSEHYLYRKLSDYPDLLSGNQRMSHFYSAVSDSTLGHLYGIGRQNGDLFLLGTGDEARLLDNFEAIQIALEDIVAIDSLLAISSSQPVTDSLLQRRNVLTDTVAAREESSNAVWAQWISYRTMEADSLIAVNDGIGTVSDSEENEKILHGIYLKTVTKNLRPTLSQKAQIKEIAEQCPLGGGPAVYRARAWHAILTGEYLDPGNCLGVSDRSSAKEILPMAQTTGMAVYPNPASGKMTVECSAESGQTLQLINQLGMEVLRHPMAEGFNRIELDVQHLPAGLYVCRLVQGPDRILSKKVIVVK